MSLFGTDGVRGIPGRSPLTPGEIRRLGLAAGKIFLRLGRRTRNGTPLFIMMGRDTRRSGPALGRDLASGFAAAGIMTRDLGVIPTPGVSYLTARGGAEAGVVISASHNPAEFNGIKFFARDGFKLSVDVEDSIETAFGRAADPGKKGLGRWISADPSGLSAYLDFLRSTYPATADLSGVRLVIDGSNGAASSIAPEIFRGLGARVYALGCTPNGKNINKDCGALATDRLRREVLRRKADVGIALDGDADRAIFVDEKGRLLNGDALIALAALDLHGKGLLAGRRVVLTVMSNLGLIEFLKGRGIGSVIVPVGDRNVTDALVAGDFCLGGEASGHVVYRRLAPTGDGLLTALQTLAVWRETGRPISRVRSLYREFPQVLKNLCVSRRIPLPALKVFQKAVGRYQKRLKGRGRVFVRYSGTEPLLRILVEGRNRNEIVLVANDLARIFLKDMEAGKVKGV